MDQPSSLDATPAPDGSGGGASPPPQNSMFAPDSALTEGASAGAEPAAGVPASSAKPSSATPPHRNPLWRALGGCWRHKLWTLPLTLLVVAAALLATPTSRYPILALGLKRQFSVTITDSKTNTPVSGASVSLDGQSTTTDSAGRAKFAARVGKRLLGVHKKYYQATSDTIFVGIATAHNSIAIQLAATGRQVPLSVINKITGKAIAEASIMVLDTEARTDSKGMATIVLPTRAATQPATITADGYNEATVSIQVTSAVVSGNSFALTPAGHLYFLSNQSGAIDVVSTNLDGTGRKTILAGTGNEDPASTVLLASRDWQNLALLSKRDDSKYAKLYLITAKDDKLTTIDQSAADFTPVGWSDHTFVYQVNLDGGNGWQPGQVAIKSYDADTNKLVTIDQTNALGTNSQYIYQNLSFINIVGSRVVYGFAWYDAYNNYEPNRLGGQKNVMLSANVDGSNKQSLREIALANGTTLSYMTSVLFSPEVLYIQASSGGQPAVYYTYQSSNNSVTQSSTLTDSSYSRAQQNYTTYLVSPTGKSTFWDLPRDGKNTLFVGDSEGQNGQQIAAQSDYSPFGWYTDNYLLVQKGGNELYVMPADDGSAPLKLSDYYRPLHSTLYGYGGGYGGL